MFSGLVYLVVAILGLLTIFYSGYRLVNDKPNQDKALWLIVFGLWLIVFGMNILSLPINLLAAMKGIMQ